MSDLHGALSGGSLSGALSGGSLCGCMSGGLSRQQVNQMIWDILPTDTASGSIASFPDGADNVPVEVLSVSLEPIQSGSGTPSPTNIRPITGHTDVGVTRTGKNLLPINDKTLTNINWFSVDFDQPIKVSGSMTVSAEIATNHSAPTCRLALYNGSTALRFFQLTPNAGRVSVTASVSGTITRAVYLAKETSGSFTGTTVWKNTQLELGSATDYEPYTADTIEVQLGQTVYGGSLDVLTGVLTVDRAMVTLDESNTWIAWSNCFAVTPAVNIPTSDRYYPDATKISCNSFRYVTTAGSTPWNMADGDFMFNAASDGWNGNLSFMYSTATSVNEWKQYLSNNPIQVVYPLKNVITIDLTAHELTTLLGTNNIWSDSGDVSVEYRADIQKYIAKVIAEAIS